MGKGIDSIAHRCALAMIGKGGVTVSMLEKLTGLSKQECSRAMTQIVDRPHIYQVTEKIERTGERRYRVVYVTAVIGKPGSKINQACRPVIARCVKTGGETWFRSIKQAAEEGYTGDAIRRAVKTGKEYAGCTWRASNDDKS